MLEAFFTTQRGRQKRGKEKAYEEQSSKTQATERKKGREFSQEKLRKLSKIHAMSPQTPS